MAKHDSQAKVIQSLYGWFGDGLLWVNRRYQRKLVWTLEEKQKLVESILREYPVPAVLLAERDGGNYEVIDGLQRLHTLMSFIEGSFPTVDGKYFDIAQFTTAAIRRDEGAFDALPEGTPLLSAREVATFLDYELPVSIMRGATAKEIDDVFGRINTYGHRLSDQERRQAGVQDDFAGLVRLLSSAVRKDASADELLMSDMPSISIDLPKTNHGYMVSAAEVFWVEQGILRSTGLRDSEDEQCVADIVASIAGGELLPRSKEALDLVYLEGTAENKRVAAGLDSYGPERLRAEFKFIIGEVESIVAASSSGKLRNILFSRKTNNAFPAVFAVLFIALHETLIVKSRKITNYPAAAAALTGLDRRIDTNRGSTTPSERRHNVNSIKGLIEQYTVETDHKDIYGEHSTTDIDNGINRSRIEAPHFELKQGLLRLDDARSEDPEILPKIVRTVVAIANNGKNRAGTLLVGVADKPADIKRVRDLYGIEPRILGGDRGVVGVRREAEHLGITVEEYVGRVKTFIRNSGMSEPLKSDILAGLAYNDYFGLGVLVISVPPQSSPSLHDGKIYVRQGDDTVEATGAEILAVAGRFS